MAFQYSGGISSPGPGVLAGGTFPRTAAAFPSFSICFGVGIDQAINGSFAWLEIRCSRCKTPSDVDLGAMKHPPTTFVHDLASRLRFRKCAKAGKRPAAILLQLAWQPRYPRSES